MKSLIPAIFAIYVLSPGVECRRTHGEVGQAKIVGGGPVAIDIIPYQVSLLRINYKNGKRYGSHFCGGALVDEQYVLTAAHCVEKKNKATYVRVGSSNYKKGGTVLNVTKVIIHPDYGTSGYEYDIALLKLSQKIEVSQKVKPIALCDSEPEVKQPMLISGWGHYSDKKLSSEHLKGAKVYVISLENCSNAYPYSNKYRITENVFCAEDPKGVNDACQGDSGGPAISYGKLCGVISWGMGCAMSGKPGVYTNVFKFVSWINTTIGFKR